MKSILKMMGVFLVLMALIWTYHLFHLSAKVEVRKDVEKAAAERGIPVRRVKELTVMFTKNVGLGGAGGLGAPVIVLEKVEDVFYKVDKGAWVGYVFKERREEEVVKEYWLIDNNPVLTTFVDRYPSPFLTFFLKETGEDYIVFGRLPMFEVLLSFFIGIIFVVILVIEYQDRRLIKESRLREEEVSV